MCFSPSDNEEPSVVRGVLRSLEDSRGGDARASSCISRRSTVKKIWNILESKAQKRRTFFPSQGNLVSGADGNYVHDAHHVFMLTDYLKLTRPAGKWCPLAGDRTIHPPMQCIC